MIRKHIATRDWIKQLGDIDVQQVTEVDSSPINLGNDFDELMKGSKISSSTMPSKKGVTEEENVPTMMMSIKHLQNKR